MLLIFFFFAFLVGKLVECMSVRGVTRWCKRGEPVEASLEEATEVIRGLEHLCCDKRLKWLVLFSMRKAAGRPYCSLPVPEGGLQASWRGTFYKRIE